MASSCVVALISLASWLRSLTNLTTPFSLSFTTGPVAVSGGDTHRPKREMKHHVTSCVHTLSPRRGEHLTPPEGRNPNNQPPNQREAPTASPASPNH